MFHSFLTDEYEVCRRVFGFDDERLARLARNGVGASFADDAMKADLEQGIATWLAEES
jgi:adenosine deaminase